MKLQFKKQEYQDEAVKSIVDCFLGQPKKERVDLIDRYTIKREAQISLDNDGIYSSDAEEQIEVMAYGNHPLLLNEKERRKNIKDVQRLNDIDYTDKADLNEFSVEMETGTGKTFTYIKMMYELNAHYGWSKFIVMVPSIAIREGVYKSFQITQEYFQSVYHKKVRFFIYNSANSSNIANINNFAEDNAINVMIINHQAFAAKGAANRKIYEELDEMNSKRPIDVIKSVRPILIVDEPQKFGDKTESLFAEFKPLFTVRFSATHKKGKEYNKVYRLDAIDAYNNKLVKKINVKGIEILHDKSEGAYVFLDTIEISDKHEPVAIMEIEVKSSDGVKKKTMKFKNGDSLYTKSGELTSYKNFSVSEIDYTGDVGKVSFTNGFEISIGQAVGNVEEDLMTQIQIKETIKSHLEKERQLYKKGIKVLSLFFIDEVAKYKDWSTGEPLKGQYAKMFEDAYIEAINEQRDLLDEEYRKYLDENPAGKVHNGYFSIDKKGHEVDPSINDKKEYESFDEDAYDLIMKDKERLLSLDEPVRFIFSHSALREGWDNPNIFQICTLKHSNSEISKRQEIGRGLRICVNKNGERMDSKVLEANFHPVNTLTVIASESYDSFAKALQKEIAETVTTRPKNLTTALLTGRILFDKNDNEFEIDDGAAFDLVSSFVASGYVDKKDNFKVQEKLFDDLEKGTLEVPEEYIEYKDSLEKLLIKKFLAKEIDISNDRKQIKKLEPNENFEKFKELWNKINIKTRYQVDFNSNELIEKSIIAINNRLNVARMIVIVTTGNSGDSMTRESIQSGTALLSSGDESTVIESYSPSTIKYDLIGEIVKDTGLTRRTVSTILQKISPQKFEMFKYNPEEFIRKVCKIINEEKSTTVIEGISYHKLDEKYDNEIFTINTMGEIGKNVTDVKKCIYDYLITDSENERKFANKLESGEVTVYAKLPSGFKIPTPVGNYNPDWAIVFDNHTFKHIYFIAETKGSMDSLELRDVEKAKIECAKRHFKEISNDEVQYDMVDSYEKLIELITA